MPATKRYVILPAFGFDSSLLAQNQILRAVGQTVRLAARSGGASRSAAGRAMLVLHSTHENGPKLVEMTEEAELNLRLEVPGIKVVPPRILP